MLQRIIDKNNKRVKLLETIAKHRQALEEAEKQLSDLEATPSALVGKRGWKCELVISNVAKERLRLGIQGYMIDMSFRLQVKWWRTVDELEKGDDVTDVEGAIAEAVNKFVTDGSYQAGTYNSDALVVGDYDAPAEQVSTRLVTDLQYYCDDPNCEPEAAGFGSLILFNVMELVGKGKPTRTHDWGPEEDEEPVHYPSAGGFRNAIYQEAEDDDPVYRGSTFESPVPSVRVVDAVFASRRASAPTGAPPPQPRTFKPSLADVETELDNFANDIERPQDLTPEKVQEMIYKGELPPSKRPPPSWEELDREMANIMKIFEERNKEQEARRQALKALEARAARGE